MNLGTKSKTTPSGLPAAGWWRRVVAGVIDNTLNIIVFWFAGVVMASVIGKVVWTALTQTIIDVREKVGFGSGAIAATSTGNVQQQLQDLLDTYRASGTTLSDFGDMFINAYINNLNLTAVQALLLFVSVIAAIYFVIYNQIIRIHRKGRTYGDDLVGIYTVNENSVFPSYGTAIVRYLCIGVIISVISAIGSFSSSLTDLANGLVAVVWLVDILLPLVDPHARTLHDRIAGTYPTHPDRFGFALNNQSSSSVSD